MAKELMPPAAAVALLSELPAKIAELTARLNERQLRQPEKPGEWSCVEILAHLRACADVWEGIVARMLEEKHPTIRYVSPRTWILNTDYNSQTFADSFAAFKLQRKRLLKRLAALKPGQWQRGATVLTATLERELNVHYYIHSLAAHENRHIAQFAKTVRAVQ
ncbi:MAG TPA: DinB family protein [Anaerolineales bacterium]|nr:DinB family protein [Anaerolineales bacterium]HRQ92984.1 DinB family protein [Anaerolineales bacterium]